MERIFCADFMAWKRQGLSLKGRPRRSCAAFVEILFDHRSDLLGCAPFRRADLSTTARFNQIVPDKRCPTPRLFLPIGFTLEYRLFMALPKPESPALLPACG